MKNLKKLLAALSETDRSPEAITDAWDCIKAFVVPSGQPAEAREVARSLVLIEKVITAIAADAKKDETTADA